MSARTLFETAPAKLLGRRPTSAPKPVTLADIELGLQRAARLVLVHGEKYLPIFERLEREREAFSRQDDTIARVTAVASQL